MLIILFQQSDIEPNESLGPNEAFYRVSDAIRMIRFLNVPEIDTTNQTIRGL